MTDNDQLVVKTAEALDIRLDVAGIGSRSYAFIIDWHIRFLLLLTWFLGAIAFMGRNWWPELTEGQLGWVGIIYTAMIFALYFLYHPVLEVLMRGSTPGKRWAGVRIVTREGKTPGAGALLIRNLFRILDALPGLYLVGLISAFCTRYHVRIGDLAAGTVLVHVDKVSAQSVQQAARLAIDAKLSVQQQGLLLDVLDRWKDLDREVRIDLAQRLLASLDEALPIETNRRRLEQLLYAQLQGLLHHA